MARQRAISSPVRRQPMQNPSPSSVHTFVQGDWGGVAGIPISGVTLNYGGCSPILQTRKTSQNKNLNGSSSTPAGERVSTMNPLNNHRQSLILGIIVAVVIAAIIGPHVLNQLALARWLHIVAGVFWIGLLYYFNVAQVPALADAAADKGGPGGAGITKYVAPRALFWFRWAALVTWLAGAWLLGPRFVPAFSLGATVGWDHSTMVIGIGAWLGTIMLFNVWGLIWPNQKKILGLKPATDEEKAKARKVALYASRTNFVLSIPMLMCMVGATHGLPF
jgi:hypothetical protein